MWLQRLRVGKFRSYTVTTQVKSNIASENEEEPTNGNINSSKSTSDKLSLLNKENHFLGYLLTEFIVFKSIFTA